ncbi:hypothetical protein [Acinetobacter junii]|uniref:hypothetical protein n=1 Tax=Acinetobacter junii TaxID=40215 RepID=UPI00124F76A3|nr:hypothetical protein [Acinetobacter junii]
MKKFLLLSVVLLTACSKQQLPSHDVVDTSKAIPENELIKESMGYKLVVIEDGKSEIPLNDPRVGALNGKLEELNIKTGMPVNDIADMARFAEKTIQSEGVNIDINEVLDVF